jgi:RND family efflux transporter MFP subunit
MRKIIIIGIVLAGALGAFAVWKFNAAEAMPVKTVAVEQGPLAAFLTATGKVASGHEVRLTSQMAGQIVEITVREGQRVPAGKVLARLEGREVEAQIAKVQAALRLAQAEAAQVMQTVERLRRVVPSGLEPRHKLEDAEAQLKSAQAREEVAAAELALARVVLGKLSVVAPFSGLITLIPVRTGQWVAPPEALFTLVDSDRREIEVKVDADDSANIAVGQEVSVSSDAFPGRQWSEKVMRVAPTIEKEESANTVIVYISLSADAHIDNGNGAQDARERPLLRFGQQVDVKIRTAFQPKVLKLPFGALISKDDKTWVAVISEQGRVKFLPVITGIEDLTHTEILQGVTAGQQVILPEGKTLNEDDRVRPAPQA